jgi:ankyrin repeat protein
VRDRIPPGCVRVYGFCSYTMVGFVGRNMDERTSEQSLRRLIEAIAGDDGKLFSELLGGSSALATGIFSQGATRKGPNPGLCFIKEIGHSIYSGDTALHFAAASYRQKMADQLIRAGANVRAKNRRGSEPLHAAAVGLPGSPTWNPATQAATIVCLIEAGADPNAQNMDGATPLHRAVRTRCAGAVRALLSHGADPAIRNKNGSTALQLALHTTGRGGSGSCEAKAQQQEILLLLQGR